MSTSYDCSWDVIDALVDRIPWERWAIVNTVQLLDSDNTIPFIARYRKEQTNNMPPEIIRNVTEVYETLKCVQTKVVTCLKAVEKLGKLTPQLKRAFQSVQSLNEVDHLYASYKTGSKRSLAERARELGLEDCAMKLLERPNLVNLNHFVKANVKGLQTLKEVQTGIQHIIADMISKDKDTMDRIRDLCKAAKVTLECTKSKSVDKKDQKDTKHKKETKGKNKSQLGVKKVDAFKFELYFDFQQPIRYLKPHQVLAINRGEAHKILSVKVVIPISVQSQFFTYCCHHWLKSDTSQQSHLLIKASIDDAYKRLIQPLLARQYRSEMTKDAEKASVDVFASNLKSLLLVPPVRGCSVLGIDPGFRNGCKFAMTSLTGDILETGVAYLHSHDCKQYTELKKIQSVLLKHRCEVLAIGNGTACRETEKLISECINNHSFSPLNIVYCIVNEAGASIYSASDEAMKEMPDLDINIRSAVSIARRLQNPLAELVKIEPRHIGVGMYQHDVSEAKLKTSLGGVVVDCVSFVGVDLNVATEALLRQVASLDRGKARKIISWREEHGAFISREQLKEVKGLGPKTFEQCAGFVRILPTDDQQVKKEETDETAPVDESTRKRKRTVAGAGKKKKAKLSHEPNRLDMTSIHPESYDATERFLEMVGLMKEQLGEASFIKTVKAFTASKKVEDLASEINIGIPTMQLIVDGLQTPVNYDMREAFEKPLFRQEVTLLENLRCGMELTGRVTNMTHFGAFVDIGVGNDGLLHVSQMRQYSVDVIKIGQKLKVKVQNVDMTKKRIGLTMVTLL